MKIWAVHIRRVLRIYFGLCALLVGVETAQATNDQCFVTTTTPNLGAGWQNLPCMPHGVAVVVTSGAVTATVTADASAADPTYSAGANPFSQDLSGHLRVVLGASALVIGKVGIDQTTPGTTNAVSLAQINAATVLAGNGVTGAGSQRVTVASDNTPFPIKIDQTTPGTTNAMALSSLGANAVSAGNGVSGTGTLRVTVASDSTGSLTNPSIGASGATVKTSSTLMGVSDGTNQQPLNAPLAIGDAASGNNMLAVGDYVWNGASWDRLPGTTAGVKSSITSAIPGTAATNLGKAEDAVAGSGDTGVAALHVGNEAQSALAADGDYVVPAVDTKGNTLVVKVPTATSFAGIAPVNSSAVETGHVIKASAGNLYSCTFTTTSAAGYFAVHNSTTVPAAGAVTPVDAVYVGAFGSSGARYDPPLVLSTGISVSFSTATTPFTKTDSATAFISCQAK